MNLQLAYNYSRISNLTRMSLPSHDIWNTYLSTILLTILNIYITMLVLFMNHLNTWETKRCEEWVMGGTDEMVGALGGGGGVRDVGGEREVYWSNEYRMVLRNMEAKYYKENFL